MKHNKFVPEPGHKPAGATRAAADFNRCEADFAASQDEADGRDGSSYVNQSSLPGDAVQLWLEAEARKLAELNLSRVHGLSHWF
jgi:hypothetical protein